MSDPTESKRRGNPAMRAGGPSLNPKGRPKLGDSLAEAMRLRFPVERICDLAEALVTGAESETVRMSALQMIAERTAGKAPQVVEMTVGQRGDDDLIDLTTMTPAQLDAAREAAKEPDDSDGDVES